jgi:formyl-CoA transferase
LADKTRMQAVELLAPAGIVAGPSLRAEEVVDDPHVAARNMLVEVPRTDGEPPYLVPGNPVKLSNMAEGPETRVPWVGEHTDEVLRAELGLTDDRLSELRATNVIT